MYYDVACSCALVCRYPDQLQCPRVAYLRSEAPLLTNLWTNPSSLAMRLSQLELLSQSDHGARVQFLLQYHKYRTHVDAQEYGLAGSTLVQMFTAGIVPLRYQNRHVVQDRRDGICRCAMVHCSCPCLGVFGQALQTRGKPDP